MNETIKNDRAAWLQGPPAECSAVPPERKNPWRLVLLGAPGVGKGTQAKELIKVWGIPQISTGDLFRENIKNATELGKLAQSFMNKGELVPDDVTIAMMRERLKQPRYFVAAL